MYVHATPGGVNPLPDRYNVNDFKELRLLDQSVQDAAIEPQVDIYSRAPLRYCILCHQNRPWFEVTLGPLGWECAECCRQLEECGELDLHCGAQSFPND